MVRYDPPNPTAGPPLIRLAGVEKTYDTPSGPFTALHRLDFQVQAGEFVAVVGKSGSGKSTLINVLTGIDRASAGQVVVAGTHVHALREGPLARWRGRSVGVVFQFYQLLPTLTVVENVMLPMDFCGTFPVRERRARALAQLERVGIADQADKLPATLSGGQQQRAAIARALANDPAVLVADEPTGNLDSRTADAVLRLFAALADEGRTVVMVTHERDVAAVATRVVRMADGAIVADERATAEVGRG
ncbi:MAG TPA: ABC transporter ATP-binding protein [Longimicrobiaceae bacterium]|nr:ABC transporter ATP-binding protein [Longimicrobiaceae bacterium]